MSDLTSAVLVIIGAVIAFIVLVIGIPIYYGWALSLLWLWFLVPTGLPAISTVTGAGIVLIISFLRGPENFNKENKYIWFSVLLGPIVSLLVGSIILHFM